MYEQTYPKKRYQKTLAFLKGNAAPPQTILDLGLYNPFSKIMIAEGYRVTNTQGEDLDFDRRALLQSKAELVTAFEIFEHLLNPFEVLLAIQAPKLCITVPLRLWFSSAYRSKTDLWDRHYHEFEDWQLDWLLEKTGWKIKAREKWTHPVNKPGIRPVLRKFVPRYYAVYAEKV
ncbi:MAG: methyltransferase [Bacteroidetes bacterium]|nr:methyltransferase [Bacteroidota bacterium]